MRTEELTEIVAIGRVIEIFVDGDGGDGGMMFDTKPSGNFFRGPKGFEMSMDEGFEKRIVSDLHTDEFGVFSFEIRFVVSFDRVIATFDRITRDFSTY